MSSTLPSREAREGGWTPVHPPSAAQIDLIAERIRVLGDATRIKLLNRLREGEASVGELTAAIGTTEQNVSKHLGVLHRAGLVSRRKQGNFVYYAVDDGGIFALCEDVCDGLRRRVGTLGELTSTVAPR